MDQRNWLVIDTSAAAGIRFSEVVPSSRPVLGPVHTVSPEGKPTFTDVLQAYARETGRDLGKLDPLLVIAGAASGEMISLTRSNWTITRAGLASLFGTRVRIINDVVAMGWAATNSTSRAALVRGTKPAPDFTSPGRMAMVYVGGGVGAAIIDIDREGYQRVMETEIGHMDFAPQSERELKLAEARRGSFSQTSWEAMLTTERNDECWGAFPEMRELERDRMLGEWFGRFLANLVHAQGAWNGVMLAGPRAAQLTTGSAKIAFEGAFTKRRQFQRLLLQVPVWSMSQSEAVLSGGAALMAVRAAQGGTRLAA
ncbi:glucokinase [Sphingomicrobium astaxanthinifaciens]|uniref:glucokinase n=1 Tax=Sphingomicrobium astaxanthinifaciens TaxID=1227949 RepID=UPI001FCA9F89|nr:glucokinase [Sphingomicrobium astaxanthinifaciens]MCJ7421675.1 glucokinase [Sphingomicrobium astaxanthinifaciens]